MTVLQKQPEGAYRQRCTRRVSRLHICDVLLKLACAVAFLLSSHDKQAFTSGNNGKQSIDEINSLIGQRIKEAAAQIGTFRVWQANATIGKYVRQAAEDAATGKLKPKKSKR